MTQSFKTADELQHQLGESLLALRLNRRVSQKDLAAKSGVSLRSLQRLEAGRGSTVESLLRYLKGLEAAEVIDMIAPRPTVSPIALMRSGKVPRRVRRSKNELQGGAS